MNYIFRDLTADEIECRPAIIKETGLSILLYKNARVDMDILDETVGPMNWQREHTRENANCIVSIWSDKEKMWVAKEDTGKESFSEKEKGLASDSFKRACFNWGIGRELYTAPFIWISSQCFTLKNDGGKLSTTDTFSVSNIKIENKVIVELTIVNNKTNAVVYDWKKEDYNKTIGAAKLELIKNLKIDKETALSVLEEYGYEKSADIKIKDFSAIYKKLKEMANETGR